MVSDGDLTNVRELRNAMERAALLSVGELILPEHLPVRVRAVANSAAIPEFTDPEDLGEIPGALGGPE